MKKLLTFLLTALLAFSVGWAAEVTITMANQGWSTGSQSATLVVPSGDVTLTFTKGTNAPYFDGTNLRIYKSGGSMTVEASGNTITSIVITGSNLGNISAANGTFPNGANSRTWTGSVTSEKFTASGTTSIATVTVTYVTGGTSEPNWYKKVTKATDLAAGKQYIFMYENGSSSIGMGALNSSSYGTPISVLDVANNKVDIGGTEVMEMTLGGATDVWTFQMSNGKYLAQSNNHAYFLSASSVYASPDDYTKWTITPGSTSCSIQNNNCVGYYIHYNASGNVFGNYYGVSAQSPIALYVKYEGIADTPTFTPAAGTYTEAQDVEISCGTSGATIYYTTDGSTPTTSSTVYSSPIPVTEGMTIKAIAVAAGYDDSEVATATYTIIPAVNTTYEKITSTNDLKSGDYLIVYEDGNVAFDGSRDQLDAVENTFGVTISNDEITTSTQGYFTYDATAGTLKSASGYYIGQTGTGNGLVSSKTFAYTNTITIDNDENAVITAVLTNGIGPTLRYNSASNQKRFRYYGSGQQAIQLYRKKSTDPVLSVNSNALTIELPYNVSSANTTFTLTGENLTENVTMSFNGAEGFTISPSSSTLPISNGQVSQEYTVTYSGTSTSPVTATVTFTSTGAEPVTVTITASKQTPPPPTMTATPNPLEFGTIDGGTLNVNAAYLDANVNLSVLNDGYNNVNTDKWTVTPTTINTADGSEVNTPATVNYGGRRLKSDNTVRVSTTTNGVANVDVPVHYKHSGPVYIVTSSSNWNFTDGIEMSHSGDVYSYTLNATSETYLVFTKKVGNDVDWNSGYLFGPVASGDWWLTEESMNTDFAIDSTAYHVVKMHNGTYTITLNAATNKMRIVADVHAPVFSHEGGRYYDPIDVEITSDTHGAHIYYTLDGSEPSANNGTLYTGPVTISDESTTLKAVAIYGDVTSPVTSATYTIKPKGSDEFELVTDENDITAGDDYVLVYSSAANHAMSVHNGSYYTAAEDDGFSFDGNIVTVEDDAIVNIITLIDAQDNGKFYIKDMDDKYIQTAGKGNVNRSDNPISKWSITLVNGAASISSGDWNLQYNASSPRYACYANTVQNAKLYKRVGGVKPIISPEGGTANKRFEGVDVTITAPEGYDIYYTTDGSTPTVNSTPYTDGFHLPYGSAPTTVKAIAVDGEGKVSRVTTVVYYWDRVQVSISPASKEVVGNVDVTITPSPSDATVTYTINGGESQTYNGPFTVQVNEENTPVTVEATAVKGESTATASVTYTYKDGGVNSIAEFLALDNNEERFFKNPVVVLFDYSQNGDQDYIWVKDRTGYMKLFIQPGFDEDTSKPRYNNGDVIPEGFTVKKITYTEHDASFIEGKSEDPSVENFKNPTKRALADPEQVKLSELLANPAYYNDRYLYINKLEITGHSGTNYTVASDENGDGTSEVSGNNVIIYNKFPTWKDKDGTSHTVAIPDADGTYYNVTFIFQKYGSVYEIMPVEFTEWVDNSIRLEDLVKVTETGGTYTISNDLHAVKVTWDDNKGKFAIFAKDDEMYANMRKPLDGQETYLIRYQNGNFINSVEQEDYDQSNWIEILIPSSVTDKFDGGYQGMLDAFKGQFENKILPGGSIQGTYVDALNPTIVYNLSTLPNELDETSAYKPNIYTPANFLLENIDDTGDEPGAKSYRDDVLGEQLFFMMDGKPQEMGMVVWCYYPGSGDYFYIPERAGDQVNGHRFHGNFKADMSLCEDANVSTQHGSSVKSCYPDASNKLGNDIEQVALYGFNAIVRKNPAYNWSGRNGAPRRVDVVPYEDGIEKDADGNPRPAFIIYPINAAANATGTVTAVAEFTADKAVESVRYYNIMGMESKKPFEGINIVVTRYTDGSTSTTKVLR